MPDIADGILPASFIAYPAGENIKFIWNQGVDRVYDKHPDEILDSSFLSSIQDMTA